MNVKLQQLRKLAGLTQLEMADKLGEKIRTYGAWERGESMMSLEQAYNCAVILGCSIDEIAGVELTKPEQKDSILQDIEDAYNSMNGSGRTALHMVAQSLSRDPSNNKKDIGALPQASTG